MHLTIMGIGSRGDVQPLIPVACRLQAAGHRVRFATHKNFESLVRGYDFEFRLISGDSAAFYAGAAGGSFRDRMRYDAVAYKRFVEDYLGAYIDRLLDDCWNACQDTDAIISWPWTRVGPTLAEKLGIASVLVSLAPVTYLPTREFSNPFQGDYKPNLGPEYNLESWKQAKPLFAVGQERFHQWRRQLDLPILGAEAEEEQMRTLDHLFCWSEQVLPKPAEWPDCMHITGFWFLDHEVAFQPPPRLQQFLEAGDPPLVIGFGSQTQTSAGLSSKALTELVIRAVDRCGHRAIFVTGFGGLHAEDLPKNILAINNVLYSWLLPRCAALVHHGGAGSTSEGLRAGLPGLGIPFGYDQPLWAQRIHDIGVGVAPIPAAELNVNRFAESLAQLMEDEAMRQRASQLGERLRAEDGVGCAVRLIDSALRKNAPLQNVAAG